MTAHNREGVDARELARLVREHRHRTGLSLRAAAEASGCPFNTLTRVEKGRLPDLANFARLARWAGFDPDVILGRTQAPPASPLDDVRAALHRDPTLDEAAADQIAGVVASLHANLARRTGSAVHVHVAHTMSPRAAALTGDILDRMATTLGRRAEGATP